MDKQKNELTFRYNNSIQRQTELEDTLDDVNKKHNKLLKKQKEMLKQITTEFITYLSELECLVKENVLLPLKCFFNIEYTMKYFFKHIIHNETEFKELFNIRSTMYYDNEDHDLERMVNDAKLNQRIVYPYNVLYDLVENVFDIKKLRKYKEDVVAQIERIRYIKETTITKMRNVRYHSNTKCNKKNNSVNYLFHESCISNNSYNSGGSGCCNRTVASYTKSHKHLSTLTTFAINTSKYSNVNSTTNIKKTNGPKMKTVQMNYMNSFKKQTPVVSLIKPIKQTNSNINITKQQQQPVMLTQIVKNNNNAKINDISENNINISNCNNNSFKVNKQVQQKKQLSQSFNSLNEQAQTPYKGKGFINLTYGYQQYKTKQLYKRSLLLLPTTPSTDTSKYSTMFNTPKIQSRTNSFRQETKCKQKQFNNKNDTLNVKCDVDDVEENCKSNIPKCNKSMGYFPQEGEKTFIDGNDNNMNGADIVNNRKCNKLKEKVNFYIDKPMVNESECCVSCT